MDEELNENQDSQDEENKSGISADLIRGHINTIILRTLYDRDKYGYEIIEEIETKSKGQYSLKQPTLYSALKRLESQGYINAYWKTDEVSQGGRRKYYTLTESGKAVTEKNQSEWEYSRTVIDNLISDRSFDFTQPPPSQLDLKILKNSTSRVPIVKDEDEEKELPAQPIPEQTVQKAEQAAPQQIIETSAPQPVVEVAQPAPVPEPVQEKTEQANEEQMRRQHENYLKLISEPVDKNDGQMPYSDNIDTEKLIYINKPETVRDYKNLIGNLFDKTIVNKNVYAEPQPVAIQYETAETQMRVNVSEYKKADGAKRATYDKFGTLFKTSLIVFAILLFEFALSLIFRNELGVTIGYPFVIFAIAVAQLMVFGILHVTDKNRNQRKPIGHAYLTTSIIISIVLIVVIFLFALLLNVNFSLVGDIFAKIILPAIVALNVPVFACLFYVFSK